MIERRLAPVSAYALFLWGMLLGLAPIVSAYVGYQDGLGVWITATVAGLAAAVVVGLFMFSTGRKL